MSQSNDGKESFELDLLPVMSVMSICICFLLLTAVWQQIGSMDIQQGLGQDSSQSEDQKSTGSLWITMKGNGTVQLKAMDVPQLSRGLSEKSFVIGAAGSGWPALEKHAAEIKRSAPELKTALIMPDGRVNYGDVIRMMDRLKLLEIAEIGVAPM